MINTNDALFAEEELELYRYVRPSVDSFFLIKNRLRFGYSSHI